MSALTTPLLLLVLSTAPPSTVRLAFAGDVMLADGIGEAMARGEDPLAFFMELLHGADLALGNLECSVSTRGKAVDKPYAFRADPRVVPVLGRAFGAVTVANNHSGDFGPDALVDTLQLLSDARIGHFGAGRNLAEAHAPLIVDIHGVRVAFLGYNEFFPRSFEATASRAGVAWSEDEQVVLDIRAARHAGADLVIPFMHWGLEQHEEPSARQRELAHRMIDAGADAVVGSHPHVRQPVEIHHGKVIAYSLGNFVFDGFSSERTLTGLVLRMEMDRQGVARWDTVVSRIDEKGFPHPDLKTPSPCGVRDDAAPRQCLAGKPMPATR